MNRTGPFNTTVQLFFIECVSNSPSVSDSINVNSRSHSLTQGEVPVGGNSRGNKEGTKKEGADPPNYSICKLGG